MSARDERGARPPVPGDPDLYIPPPRHPWGDAGLPGGPPRWGALVPPPRRHRRRTVLAVALAAVALPLLAVAAMHVDHALSGADAIPGRPTGTLRAAWAVDGTKDTQTTSGFAGSWADAHEVVDGRSDGMIAYNLADGRQLWSYQVPVGQVGCSMSPAPVDGVGVFAYGPTAQDCTTLVAVDAATGRTLWPHPVDLAGTGPFQVQTADPHLAVADGVVAAQGPGDTLAAYSLTTGAHLWSTPVDANLAADTCTLDDAAAVAGTVYGLYSCEGANRQYDKLTGYDAATGRPVWQGDVSALPPNDPASLWPLGGDLGIADGTDPRLLVFHPGTGAPLTVDLSPYDTDDAFNTTGQAGDQRIPHGFAVFGDTLYLQGGDGSGGPSDTVAAVSLSTGRPLWSTSLPGATPTVVGADARGLHAVLEVPGRNVYQLAVYAPGTGRVAYGAATTDGRFTFTASSALYLEGDYLVELPASVLAGTPEVIVLTGAAA